jgi:hypothetical protein
MEPPPAPAAAAPPPPGVNALAGTMAADAATFAAVFGQAGQQAQQAQQAPAAAPPPQNYGGPPQQNFGAPAPNYGAPPQQNYGAPPQQNYGAPPQNMAPPAGNVQGPPMGDPAAWGAQQGMPNPYGAPAPGPAAGMPPAYGQAPQQPYGGPAPGFPPQQPGAYAPMQTPQPMAPQPMMGYGQAPGAIQPPVMGTLQSAGNVVGPTKRNALMTWLMPGIVMFGGIILATILGVVGGIVGVGAISLIGSLFYLVGVFGGSIMYLLSLIKMSNELKAVTRNPSFAWWPVFIPGYNYYWLWLMVPAEVKKAKQMMGVQQPPRSIVLYIFLWHYALASDLNDMAR